MTAMILLASILLLLAALAFRRAFRAVDVTIGHDATYDARLYSEAWAHRRFLECGYIAEHPNRWRQ